MACSDRLEVRALAREVIDEFLGSGSELVDGVDEGKSVVLAQVTRAVDLGLTILDGGDEGLGSRDKRSLVAGVGVDGAVELLDARLDVGNDTVDELSVTLNDGGGNAGGSNGNERELHVDWLW